VQKIDKLLIIQPWIAPVRSNFVQTLITWRFTYHKLSKVKVTAWHKVSASKTL